VKALSLLLLLAACEHPPNRAEADGWQDIGSYCRRLEVPAGWLVTFQYSGSVGGIVFVPDQEKRWRIGDGR